MKNRRPLHWQCLPAVIILVLLAALLTGFDITRRIIIEADGQTKEVRTNAGSPAQILQEAGVALEPGDGWRLQGPNKRVQDGSVITVVRGVPFTVIRGEEAKEYRSSKETVGAALKDIGVAYQKKRVYPAVDELLQPNMQIYVLGKDEELHFSEASVEAPVKYEEDHGLNFGYERETHPGKPGKQTIVSKRLKKSGDKNAVQELTRSVTVEPTPRIIRKGMAMSVKTPDGYKRYTKKITMESTAYVATGNPTSIGIMPYEGIVAVDPRVIPYYTKMYIPGYGIAMAGDTGGDIVGRRIDVFLNDYHRAIQWGRRNVEVYILAE